MLLLIEDMTCGGCAKSVGKAAAAVDANATVEVDLSRRLVRVASDSPAADIIEAIAKAGYHAKEVAHAPPVRSGGCCCNGQE